MQKGPNLNHTCSIVAEVLENHTLLDKQHLSDSTLDQYACAILDFFWPEEESAFNSCISAYYAHFVRMSIEDDVLGTSRVVRFGGSQNC